MAADPESPAKELDIYRDTPVRLLGYANEVGESFRALISVWAVRATYGLASLYVLADTNDKAKKMYNKPSKSPALQKRKTIHAAIDTLIWQALASVIIPGFTINRVCAASLWILRRRSKLPDTARKWVTTGIGLGCIPFIVRPIDAAVDIGMDASIRKMLHITEEESEHPHPSH